MFGIKTVIEVLGRPFKNWFTKKVKGDLDQAAEYYLLRLRDSVSNPFPPVSSPGLPPHLRTGNGRAAIQMEKVRQFGKDEFTGAVFVNDEMEGFYIALLDKGIPERNIQARPFIEPTFEKYESLLYDIATGRK